MELLCHTRSCGGFIVGKHLPAPVSVERYLGAPGSQVN